MIARSLRQVATLTGAVPADLPGTVTGEVVVDSRLVEPGDLFVALRGERVDGHDHAVTACAAGAVAVLGERLVQGVPTLVVPDALAALQSLARDVFADQQPQTIGITGSSGKTTTKDLMAHVLSELAPTLAPAGSFNNELGLPLTCLRRTAQTSFAVLEYSARGCGHIAFLCGIARPHVAVVLNVGSAHLGEFGSVEMIATAKGELVESATDLVVLNADDPLVIGMRDRTTARVVTFGASAGADVRSENVVLDGDGRACFRLVTPHGSVDVALGLYGAHQVSNALAVAATVLRCTDLSLPRLAELLGSARPVSPWRMEVIERTDGVTVVNDAYNANPDSMRAALKTLAVMSRGKTRRTFAVLGPMGELGAASREAHLDLGRFIGRLEVGQLVVVGEAAAGIHAGAVLEGSRGNESIQVADVDEAVALLRSELRQGDVVLVKASRAAGLERVAAALLEDV